MEALKAMRNISVGLAVVLVGSRHDSATYVRMKKKACAEVGVSSLSLEYSDEVSQQELLTKIGNSICWLNHIIIDGHVC